MKLTKYTVVDDKGVVRSGATINVYFTGGTTKATLYSDNGTTTLSNPVTSDANGYCTFYVANGRYDLTTSGTGITTNTVTVPIFDPFDERENVQGATTMAVADGTAAAPSYSFASSTTTGFFNRGGPLSAFVSLSLKGTNNVEFIDTVTLPAAGGIRIHPSSFFSWGGGADAGTAGDTFLARDAAGTIAQRNGVNAQAFRLYNTYTDASNYERGEIAHIGNDFYVRTISAGTGTARNMYIGPQGSAVINFQGNGSIRWAIGTTGHLTAGIDNTYDIGAFGANRPRNLYVGSTVFTTAPTAQAAGTYTVLATDNTVINSVASTLTLPAVGTNTGRKLRVVTTGANAIISNASNVVPITGGAAGTAILAATAGKWADLECNGTNWIITAAN